MQCALREVRDEDLPDLFEHWADPVAAHIVVGRYTGVAPPRSGLRPTTANILRPPPRHAGFAPYASERSAQSALPCISLTGGRTVGAAVGRAVTGGT